MLAELKSRLRQFAGSLPGLNRLRSRISLNKQYRVERALLRGSHRNPNPHPSIIHFTVNKAGSQHVLNVLARCAALSGMVPVNIHGYAFHTGLPFLDHLSVEEMARYRHIFKPQGYLYSSFGGMIEGIPDLEKYRIILMVRDPRDVLVSGYFSLAYSHDLPMEDSPKYGNFVQKRLEARNVPLDEYVRAECGKVNQVYRRYADLLVKKHPSAYHLTTFEAMVQDYAGWLKDLLAYAQLEVPAPFFQALVDENERSRPVKEDIHAQKRLGRSGDYLSKLSPGTIEYLNYNLHEVLTVFGYPAA